MASFYSSSPARDQIDADILDANQAKEAAEAAQLAAEAAQAAAELSETAAGSSQTSAAASAASATASASNAASSETNAASSATSATSSASSAASSATAAAGSASDAASSKTAAATSETNAASSATSASTSASNASTSETNAASSASSAAGSATSASNSAASASTSASAAATSASNAATSESNASTSASNASSSETNAASSATAASTSETNAASSATAAAASATSASSSATTATTARDAALTALDSFDDRYLGAKSNEPTTDNDGDTLVTGALFYDSTDNAVKVWTGTAWDVAYASITSALLAENNLSDLDTVSTARDNLGLGASDSPTFTNATLTGYLAGPATFVIDPSAVGDNTGTVRIAGSLQVDGSTTTINSTTLDVDDLNITLAAGAVNAGAANGAGITIDGASASLIYSASGDRFDLNKALAVSGALSATSLSFTSSISDGTTTITGFVDEDDMASDSAALVPTQQSVKAFAQTTADNAAVALAIALG